MGVPLDADEDPGRTPWGAFFGGVAGAFYASFKLGAKPVGLLLQLLIFLLCMVILGGIG